MGAPGVDGADKPGGCEWVPGRLLLGTVTCGRLLCPLPVLYLLCTLCLVDNGIRKTTLLISSVDSRPSWQCSVTDSSPLDTEQAHLPVHRIVLLGLCSLVGVSRQKLLHYRPDRALKGRSPRHRLHLCPSPIYLLLLFMARGGGEKYLLGA